MSLPCHHRVRPRATDTKQCECMTIQRCKEKERGEIAQHPHLAPMEWPIHPCQNERPFCSARAIPRTPRGHHPDPQRQAPVAADKQIAVTRCQHEMRCRPRHSAAGRNQIRGLNISSLQSSACEQRHFTGEICGSRACFRCLLRQLPHRRCCSWNRPLLACGRARAAKALERSQGSAPPVVQVAEQGTDASVEKVKHSEGRIKRM